MRKKEKQRKQKLMMNPLPRQRPHQKPPVPVRRHRVELLAALALQQESRIRTLVRPEPQWRPTRRLQQSLKVSLQPSGLFMLTCIRVCNHFSLASPASSSVSAAAATAVLLDYLNSTNRPYSALNVYDNLHGIIGKSVVPALLDKLAAA